MKEIEQRYLEITGVSSSLVTSVKKKSGKKKQKMCSDENNSQLSDYAAEVFYHFFSKVYSGWKDIAEIVRSRVFKEDEQHLIDIFDIQCKEWGFLLREMFGGQLGTGDYGHLMIEHVSMLFRNFLSLKEYSNQGFEASHSLQRQLYSKATSHDRHGYTSSIKQLLQHFYAEKVLFMRLCFRMALQSMENGKPFRFRGCGWSRNKAVTWSEDNMAWIGCMDQLFSKIFGDDFLVYQWDKGKRTVSIAPDSFPSYSYDHSLWEETLKAAEPSEQKVQGKCIPSGVTCSSKTPTSAPLNCKPLPVSPVSKVSAPQREHSVPVNTPMCTTNAKPSYLADLRACANSNTTRGQLATLNLPPVVQIADDNIQLVCNAERINNPLQQSVRPSESALNKAYELLNRAGGDQVDDNEDEELDVAVRLGDVGVFDYRAVDIWMKALTAASIKLKVKEEERWLCNGNAALTSTQIQEVGSLLFDSMPQQEIIRIQDIIVDANDLSTLAAERYLTGFIIDGACLKYSEEAMCRGSHLYLPSITQTWASCGNVAHLKSKLKPFVSGKDLSKLNWLLTPIHVNGNHWGLLCLNMVLRQVFYDDGLKQNHPPNICEVIQILIEAVSNQPLSANWNITLPLKRFDMPKQPLVGKGCGSCGVGVILAARDFFNMDEPTVPEFHWKFEDMTKHRQMILYQFFKWK